MVEKVVVEKSRKKEEVRQCLLASVGIQDNFVLGGCNEEAGRYWYGQCSIY